MAYRSLLNRRTAAWTFVAANSRLPGAMAPLGMVFLGKGSVASYAAGSVLAAFYIGGEVLGSSTLGTRLNQGRLRLHLGTGLGIAAAAFAVMALVPHAPLPLLAAAALVSGAAPAASPGALRTVLTDIVPEKEVARAFSLDSILTEILWTAAPGIVVALALWVSDGAPMAVCAVCLGLAAVGVALIDSVKAVEAKAATARPGLRLVLSGWPIYLTSAAAMSLMAVSELVLVPLLDTQSIPVGWAGVLLMAFAGLSALSAFVFGLRSWPGGARGQSLVCLLATAVGITVMAVVPGIVGVVVGFFVAGVFQSIVMITRNLSLRERLPEPAHTAGYNAMYAVQGVGYAVSALFAAFMLEHFTPGTAILGGVAITVLLATVSGLAERRTTNQPTTSEPEPETATNAGS